MTSISKAEVVRHPMKIRRATVAAVRRLSSNMVRVTLRGEDLADFHAPGPADHVKLFLPDADGQLHVPELTEEGIRPPETGKPIARDYTPMHYRADGEHGPEVDFDFVLHGDDGPASAWAGRAKVGDELAFGGPRGSHLPPEGVRNAVVIADETGLPAAWRWYITFYPHVPVTGLFAVVDAATSSYLDKAPGGTQQWFTGDDRHAQLEAALRGLEIDGGTFVFLAGEATSIIPLRRYLRRELGLAKEQVDAHGYWKQGIVNLDHHAPLDPADPEE